jgi:cell division protein ZapA (FtsZ GTPase activity inhibitor)
LSTRISIRGRTYTVRSDGEEDLHAIASYVDAKMADLAAMSPALDPYTVAMLAALNIAQEFDRYRRTADEEIGAVDRELAAVAVLLESSLPSEEGG